MGHPQTTSSDSDDEMFGVVSNKPVNNDNDKDSDRYKYNFVDRFYLNEVKRAKHCTEEELVQLLMASVWRYSSFCDENCRPLKGISLKKSIFVYPGEISFQRLLIYRIILIQNLQFSLLDKIES